MSELAVRLNVDLIGDFIDIKSFQGQNIGFDDARRILGKWRYYGFMLMVGLFLLLVVI